jgi:ATP-binding cassette subfamily B (MDR/TAP) protein 1
MKSLNVKTLRGSIGFVPQEPSLLDKSVLENIALGLVSSSAHTHLRKTLLSDALSQLAVEVRSGEDLSKCAENRGTKVAEIVGLVQKAAGLADAVAFIDRLEHGYATTVGSSGSLISGGQKQRIALARALVRDPKILVLDEATAALDSASEKCIQAAVENVSKSRTVISIAHRLSTIQAASKIIVMKAGVILEQGTHDDLMTFNGSYADMIRLQSVKPSDEPASSRARIQDVDVDAIESSKDVTRSTGTQDHNTTSVDDKKEDQGSIVSNSMFRTMAPLIRPYLFLLLLAFSAALIVGGTYSASGTIFGNTIGSFSPCNPPSYIRSRGLLLSGLFFMLACVEFLANFTSWSVFGLISERLIYKVRVGSLHTLLQQPLQWHQSHSRSPSQLLDYITNDGNALAGFSGSIVGTLFSVIVNFIAAIVLSHIIAWRIAIVLVAIVPLLLGAGFMQLRSISRFAEEHAGAFSTSVGITVEAVSNIRTITALSLEDEVLQTYRRSLVAPRKQMVLQSLKTNIWLAIANSIGNVLYAFAHWWGSKNILEGRYTQTQYFIILIAMLVSAQLWGQLFTLAPEISRAKSAIARIAGLLELERDSFKSGSGRSTPDTDEFDHEKKDVEACGDPPTTLCSQGGVSVEFCDVACMYSRIQSRAQDMLIFPLI